MSFRSFQQKIQHWITRIGRQEVYLLLAALVFAVGVWSFINIADSVAEGDIRSFDERLLQYFRQADDPVTLIGPKDLASIVRDITALGSVSVLTLITVFAALYLVLQRQWRLLGLVLVAVLGGTLMLVLVKEIFARTRPDLVPALMDESSYSFPSGHSTLSAVVYLSLAVLLARLQSTKRLRIFIISAGLLVTALVGVSRVILGVHYPSDVLAGWSIGLAWAALCLFAAAFIEYRRNKHPLTPETHG